MNALAGASTAPSIPSRARHVARVLILALVVTLNQGPSSDWGLGPARAAPGNLAGPVGDLELDGPVNAIAVQADGKILLGGSFTKAGPAATPRRKLLRLNADGSLDAGFADPNVQGDVNALAVQPDGRILVAGLFSSVGAAGLARSGLARLLVDGTPDPSFADPAIAGGVRALALQPDGRVLAAGNFATVGAPSVQRRGLARFNADGTLDLGFADPNLDGNGRALALLPDGRVLLGGFYGAIGANATPYAGLARLKADGTLDASFADPGLGAAFGLAVQPDGKILAIGPFTAVGAGRQAARGLARINPDGTIDTGFRDPDINGTANAVLLQSDGKILVAGAMSAVAGGIPAHGLARFNADGTGDGTFADPNLSNGSSNANGVEIVAPYAAQALALSGDTILVGGDFSLAGQQSRRRVASLAGGTGPALTTAPTKGWWWNPAQGGRGFALETRGGRFFFAGFLYAPDGRSYWTVANGPLGADGMSLSGALQEYGGGQTLTSAYVAPATRASPGSVSVTFANANQATLTWPGGTIPLQRYSFGGLAAPQAGSPETGWWWNAAEGGRGYFIEVQGATMFMVAFLYDDGGNPVWYLSNGPMTAGAANLYAGSLLVCSGGQSLTGAFRQASCGGAAGSLSLQFDTTTTGVLTLPNAVKVPLTRFGSF